MRHISLHLRYALKVLFFSSQKDFQTHEPNTLIYRINDSVFKFK